MKHSLLITIAIMAFNQQTFAQQSSKSGKQRKATNSSQVPTHKKNNFQRSAKQPSFTYKLIPSEGGTFGFDILTDQKVLIHQPSRPGLPGNAGFKSKQDAEKVAMLMIQKLNNHVMPPTIDLRELDSLRIKL